MVLLPVHKFYYIKILKLLVSGIGVMIRVVNCFYWNREWVRALGNELNSQCQHLAHKANIGTQTAYHCCSLHSSKPLTFLLILVV